MILCLVDFFYYEDFTRRIARKKYFQYLLWWGRACFFVITMKRQTICYKSSNAGHTLDNSQVNSKKVGDHRH